MIDLILEVIRAILRSLYLLFEGMPALDALRRWFGLEEKGGVNGAALLLAGAAAVLGALAFGFFFWLLRRGAPGGRAAGIDEGVRPGTPSGERARE